MVLALILAIILFTRGASKESGPPYKRGYNYMHDLLRRKADVENAENEPLIKAAASPPQLPPPDF